MEKYRYKEKIMCVVSTETFPNSTLSSLGSSSHSLS
jgi:hypothetical protein